MNVASFPERAGLAVLAVVALCCACTAEPSGGTEDPARGAQERGRTETYTVDVTDYKEPQSPWDGLLSDDRLEDKHTKFDDSLIHPATIEGYRVNLSNAVIRLDVPTIKPDQDKAQLELYPSYGAAIAGARRVFTNL